MRLLLTFLFSLTLFAQTPFNVRVQDPFIPDDKIPRLANIGVEFTQVTNGWTYIDVTNPAHTSYPLFNDGLTTNSANITNLAKSLPSSGVILDFPSGTYLWGQIFWLMQSTNKGNIRIVFHSGTIIKSAYPASFPGWNSLFRFQGGSGSSYTLAADLGRDATNLSSTASMASIAAGDYVAVSEDNDSAVMKGTLSASRIHTQFFQVGTKPSSTSLTLKSGNGYKFQTALNAQVQKKLPFTNIVIEGPGKFDLSGNTNLETAIRFFQCKDFLVKDVEIYKPLWYDIQIGDCWRWEVAGYTGHQAHSYGQGGYGLSLESHAGEGIIRDNIVFRKRHSFVFQSGAYHIFVTGNFSARGGDDNTVVEHDYLLHGNYPWGIVFENNDGMKGNSDNYWGNNGVGVYLRDHLWAKAKDYGSTLGYVFSWGAERYNYQQYVISCVLGMPGDTRTEYTNSGTTQTANPGSVLNLGIDTSNTGPSPNAATPLDTNVLANLVYHDNFAYAYPSTNSYVAGKPTNGPPSYYYKRKSDPRLAWWGTNAWPLHGPDLVNRTNLSPAFQRYQAAYGNADLP